MEQKSEIIVYQPNDMLNLEVRVENETVWLNMLQISTLFERDKSVISRHISNVFREGELDRLSTVANFAIVQLENGRSVVRQIDYYNLDVIISVGYRVKSVRGTQFRIWANQVLKDYLLRGYAVQARIDLLEQRVDKKIMEHEQRISDNEKQIELFVRKALPPIEGVFCDGQIFDAYVFASQLIKSAKTRVILIDNYVDESVLLLLSKRNENVAATIVTRQSGLMLKQDLSKHNAQYLTIDVKVTDRVHDRFLIIDNNVYHIGASLKDLGKKLFALSKMELGGEELIRMFEAYPNVQ